MKTLLFLRHAEASLDVADDHERELTPGGVNVARAVGALLAHSAVVPDAVFTSSAARARQTLAMAREAGHWSAPVHASRDFYETKPRAVLDEIRHAPDAVATLLLVGHEPTWSRTVCKLTGGSDVVMRPGSLARVEVDAETWADVRFGRGRLIWLIQPDVLSMADGN